MYIRLSDLRKNKNKEGSLGKKCPLSVRISSTTHCIEKCSLLDQGAYASEEDVRQLTLSDYLSDKTVKLFFKRAY